MAEEVEWVALNRPGVRMFKPGGVCFTGLESGVDNDEGEAPAGGQATEDEAPVADEDDARPTKSSKEFLSEVHGATYPQHRLLCHIGLY